jgi:hypothetical protein
MKNRSDFYGEEFDWFAIDSNGYVAWMMSAGYGPIPDAVFQKLEQQRRIEEHLTELSGYSTKDPWYRMMWSLSATGLFVYDWKYWEGPYQRVGFPMVPRHVDKLGFPPELRDALVTIPRNFWISRKLRPELLLPCAKNRTNA